MRSRKQGTVAPLVNLLKSIYPITPEVEQYLEQNCRPFRARRGTLLLKPGEVCDKYYFVSSGLVRAFVRYGHKEITTWLNAENELITSIRGMSQQKPALEYIQVVEDTDLVEMSFAAMAYLYEHHPEMNTVGRIILQFYYAAAEERAFVSRIPNAEKRYLHFLESRPDLVNRAPLKYIASYLGMTEETLSRLRSRKPGRAAGKAEE